MKQIPTVCAVKSRRFPKVLLPKMNDYYVLKGAYNDNEIKPFEAHFTVNMDNQRQTYAF